MTSVSVPEQNSKLKHYFFIILHKPAQLPRKSSLMRGLVRSPELRHSPGPGNAANSANKQKPNPCQQTRLGTAQTNSTREQQRFLIWGGRFGQETVLCLLEALAVCSPRAGEPRKDAQFGCQPKLCYLAEMLGSSIWVPAVGGSTAPLQSLPSARSPSTLSAQRKAGSFLQATCRAEAGTQGQQAF